MRDWIEYLDDSTAKICHYLPSCHHDQGPTGPTGPDGATGAQGETGPDGATGAQGETGAQGPTGEEGFEGMTGPDGATGADGNPGPDGATGADGNPGADGATGADGNPGPDGMTGADGNPGPDGMTGPDGATGAQGPTGLQGPQGATGPFADLVSWFRYNTEVQTLTSTDPAFMRFDVGTAPFMGVTPSFGPGLVNNEFKIDNAGVYNYKADLKFGGAAEFVYEIKVELLVNGLVSRVAYTVGGVLFPTTASIDVIIDSNAGDLIRIRATQFSPDAVFTGAVTSISEGNLLRIQQLS